MNKLNKLYFLKIEIKELREEIESLSELSTSKSTGMPRGNSTSNPTEQHLLKKQKLIEKLNKKLEKYVEELTRIENFIDTIENPDVRTIARLRFIENLRWEEIGRRMHLDRTACYRKIKKYLGEFYG